MKRRMRRLRPLSLLLWGALLLSTAGCASTEKARESTAEADTFNTVTAREIRDAPHGTIQELLRGRIAGVDVYETGSGISIRIRGTSTLRAGSEPLYILDGFPVGLAADGSLSINPHDIESIEVLKSTDASFYGVRGANGVILIETKRGADD